MGGHVIWDIKRRPADVSSFFSTSMSVARSKMAVMDNDPISACLWALSGFDPALVHFVELREQFRKTGNEQAAVSMDRALGVYIEGQCDELRRAAAVTPTQADKIFDEAIGVANINKAGVQAMAITSDPLFLEVFTYAMYLRGLTSHGEAPWNRFIAVLKECFELKHPRIINDEA